MIPEGFCVDLETTIAGRIPDNIRPAGQKRFETRIIEIGAVHWKKTQLQFQCLVNPLPENSVLSTPNDLFTLLRSMFQKPDATIDFWSSVLVKRKSVTSSMFLYPETPEIWRRRTTFNRAKDFIRWYNKPSLGPVFKTEKQALQELIAFTKQHPVWLAHNGKSFDYKVLDGCAERTKLIIPANITKVDTLRLFRQYLPGHVSYSQPKLYVDIFKRNYNAHVAIDDARALAELCMYTTTVCQTQQVGRKQVGRKLVINSKQVGRKAMALTFTKKKQMVLTGRKAMALTFVKKKHIASTGQSVRSLHGVGPKTENAFDKIGIKTIRQLKDNLDTKGVTWLRSILPQRVQWKVILKSVSTSIV